MQRCDNLVELEKCCKMRPWTQKSASKQKRTGLPKFGGRFFHFFIRLLAGQPAWLDSAPRWLEIFRHLDVHRRCARSDQLLWRRARLASSLRALPEPNLQAPSGAVLGRAERHEQRALRVRARGAIMAPLRNGTEEKLLRACGVERVQRLAAVLVEEERGDGVEEGHGHRLTP